MTKPPATTICLGNEYDDKLRTRLMNVLRDMGGKCGDATIGVGGSQEIETLHVQIGNEQIVVEAETYIGITIKGDEALVNTVAQRVRASDRPVGPPG